MNRTKNINNEFDPEFGLDSRYVSENERKSEATALLESRLMRMKNLSNEQLVRAKLFSVEIKNG